MIKLSSKHSRAWHGWKVILTSTSHGIKRQCQQHIMEGTQNVKGTWLGEKPRCALPLEQVHVCALCVDKPGQWHSEWYKKRFWSEAQDPMWVANLSSDWFTSAMWFKVLKRVWGLLISNTKALPFVFLEGFLKAFKHPNLKTNNNNEIKDRKAA